MDVEVALNEAKTYQDSARSLEDRSVMLPMAFKSIYKNSKRLRRSVKNLKIIYQSFIKELEKSRLQQVSGNVIDQSIFVALKNLEQALAYQRQAENKLSQIQPFEQQAILIKESAELLDYSFVNIIKSLKQLQRRK